MSSASSDKLPLIPKEFMNSDTGAPHTNCLMCNAVLAEEVQPYMIEKAVRYYPAVKLTNVVFEFAICAKCAKQTEQQLSTHTKEQLRQYFGTHFKMDMRPTWNAEEAEEHPFNIGEWIDHCAIKNLKRSELHEYSIYARCIGDRIIPEMVPYMISGEAQDEMMQLFSNESLGFMDGFTDKYFSGPPEWKELFQGRPVLV